MNKLSKKIAAKIIAVGAMAALSTGVSSVALAQGAGGSGVYGSGIIGAGSRAGDLQALMSLMGGFDIAGANFGLQIGRTAIGTIDADSWSDPVASLHAGGRIGNILYLGIESEDIPLDSFDSLWGRLQNPEPRIVAEVDMGIFGIGASYKSLDEGNDGEVYVSYRDGDRSFAALGAYQISPDSGEDETHIYGAAHHMTPQWLLSAAGITNTELANDFTYGFTAEGFINDRLSIIGSAGQLAVDGDEDSIETDIGVGASYRLTNRTAIMAMIHDSEVMDEHTQGVSAALSFAFGRPPTIRQAIRAEFDRQLTHMSGFYAPQ